MLNYQLESRIPKLNFGGIGAALVTQHSTEIQTSSFADSPSVKIIVDMLTWMLMDKVERWTVTLKVDV